MTIKQNPGYTVTQTHVGTTQRVHDSVGCIVATTPTYATIRWIHADESETTNRHYYADPSDWRYIFGRG